MVKSNLSKMCVSKNYTFAIIILLFCTFSLTKSKYILVTGGGGYIGSHTIVELLNNNYTVIAIDNLSNCYSYNNTEKPESLKRVEIITGKNIIFYNVDIRNGKRMTEIFESHPIEVVIHFAALKSVAESIKKPIEYYDNNVAGTNNLLKVMEKNNVKQIIYSSSATVYGSPQFLPLTENHPTGQNITNPYGRSKYFTEEIFKDISETSKDWKIILLRYFNPVGAHFSGTIGEDPTGIPNNLMPYISQVAVGRREYLNIYGSDYPTADGTGIRDYIHISDLANGHIKALEKLYKPEMKGWKTYNLGTGKGYSVLECLRTFEKVSGKKIHFKFTDRRYGDVPEVYADSNLAKIELNWIAEKNLEDMCQDTWHWQTKNPKGYRNFNS